MYSAPCGLPIPEGWSKQTVDIHRLWGPHKNRAPLFVPRRVVLVNVSDGN